jgi:hypothetical protein
MAGVRLGTGDGLLVEVGIAAGINGGANRIVGMAVGWAFPHPDNIKATKNKTKYLIFIIVLQFICYGLKDGSNFRS